MPRTRLAERLQDLLLENDVLEDFLRQLSALAAEFAAAETGRPVLCSVRLARRRRPTVLAASNPEALVLDGLQDGLAEGPGLETRKTRQAVLVPDTTMDPRWRRYQRAAAQRGIPQRSRRAAAGGPGRGGHPDLLFDVARGVRRRRRGSLRGARRPRRQGGAGWLSGSNPPKA